MGVAPSNSKGSCPSRKRTSIQRLPESDNSKPNMQCKRDGTKQTLVEIWLISFPGKQIGKNPCLKKRSKLWQTTRHICSNHAPEVCGELQGANVAECHWIATCRTWQNKGQPGPLCQVIVILLLGERVAHKRGNTYSKQLAPQFLWNI